MDRIWVLASVFCLLCGCITQKPQTAQKAFGGAIDCESKTVDDRDLCYQNMALEESNLTLCDKIQAKDLRDYCQVKIRQDTSTCDELKDQDMRQWCLKSDGMINEELAES